MVYSYKMIGLAPPGLYPLINGKIAWVICLHVRARGKKLVWFVRSFITLPTAINSNCNQDYFGDCVRGVGNTDASSDSLLRIATPVGTEHPFRKSTHCDCHKVSFMCSLHKVATAKAKKNLQHVLVTFYPSYPSLWLLCDLAEVPRGTK